MGGETLEQIAQHVCGCPLTGSIQGRAGWGYEQSGLEGGFPAHSRELGLNDLKGPFPNQIILQSYDSYCLL